MHFIGIKCALFIFFVIIYSQINVNCLHNKCYNYIYFVFIHVFIEIFVIIGIYCDSYFIAVVCIYFTCISTVISTIHVFILYVFTHIYWVGSTFLLFNTCAIKFIEGKFYFKGRACYIGKIMPTCIE